MSVAHFPVGHSFVKLVIIWIFDSVSEDTGNISCITRRLSQKELFVTVSPGLVKFPQLVGVFWKCFVELRIEFFESLQSILDSRCGHFEFAVECVNHLAWS